MAIIRNAIDKILQAAVTRTTNLAGARILLTPTTNAFHVTVAGANDPASITVTAALIDLEGPISFSASGGTLTDVTATTAALTYANMSAVPAAITASVTVNGQTYSATCHITKVLDGAKGDPGGKGDPGTKGDTGASGTQFATARMYQWATATPAKPTGTTTWTWATAANASYSASDGWAVAIPANPGTPLIKLHVAEIPITAAAGVVSSTVSYANSTVSAVSQNGGNGTSGLQSFDPTVYQWAATIPAGPTGAATLTWATGAFGAAPTGWALTPGTAPSPGFTLFAARAQVSDSAAIASTGFNWSSAAVMAIGYAGGNGNPGAEGASYVPAYCASATGATTTAPAATTGKTSLPAANSGGLTGTYSATVPVLAAGQYLYQTDGIYNPATNQIIWSIPYWSSLKVAALSAISANFGAMTAGSIDLGAGKILLNNDGSARFRSVTIETAAGNTILASGVPLNPAYAAPGTLNREADFSPKLTWEFRNSLNGWTLGNFTHQLFPDLFYCTSNGADPVMASPVFSVNGAIHDKIRMRVKRLQGSSWQGQVFYSTAGGSAHGSSESFTKIIADTTKLNEWVILEWDMASLTTGGTDWKSNIISQIRIDLPEIAGDSFDIDWICIGKYGPPSADDLGALSKNAADILSGPIALQAGGAIVAGTLTFDASGNRTGGSGTAQTSKGWVGHNGTRPTIAVDATTGKATFSDEVAIGATGYNTDPGIWLGYAAGNPKLSVRTASGATFLCDPANNILEMKGATVSNPTLDTFSCAAMAGMTGSGPDGARSYGARTATVTGGKLPLTYSWTFTIEDGALGAKLTGITTNNVGVTGSAIGQTVAGQVVCTISDASGRTITAGFYVNQLHGAA